MQVRLADGRRAALDEDAQDVEGLRRQMNSLGSTKQLTTRRIERELAELDGHGDAKAWKNLADS
jgi:hypothetical protein